MQVHPSHRMRLVACAPIVLARPRLCTFTTNGESLSSAGQAAISYHCPSLERRGKPCGDRVMAYRQVDWVVFTHATQAPTPLHIIVDTDGLLMMIMMSCREVMVKGLDNASAEGGGKNS